MSLDGFYFEGHCSHQPNRNTKYGQVTTSTLVLEAHRKDNGARVTCTAKNRDVPHLSISNYTILSVQYSPSVSASLGISLENAPLKEGDDVYFICNVDANPPVTVIQWFREDQKQFHNVSKGIILAGDSLVLQRVSRHKAGRYRCRASNSIASKESNWVHLKLRYKPECNSPVTTFFLYDHPINVTCEISAFPRVPRLYWKWNSSKETFESPAMQKKSMKYDHSAGIFTITPTGGYEDRELLCYAVNELGIQHKPCKFTVKVASIPAPLSACRLANITASSLNLTCDQPSRPNFGPTSYRAEVYLENGTLYHNVTSQQPSFNVGRLDPATNYQIKVYVSRGQVTSPPVVVSAYTSRSSSKREDLTGRDYSQSRRGIVTASLTLLLLFICVVVARLCWKRKKRRTAERRREKRAEENRDQGRRTTSDETNPDVVPHIEETYDLLSVLEGETENANLNTAKEGPSGSFTLMDVTQDELRQPISMEFRSVDRPPPHRRISAIRMGSNGGRRRNTEETEDVYCSVDQIFSAEESVV